MVVPKFEEFINPVLKALYDENTALSNKKLIEIMAIRFCLSEEDLLLRTKSGNETQVYNRVQWSRNYLERAGYAERAGKGCSIITEKGRKMIKSGMTMTVSQLRSEAQDNIVDSEGDSYKVETQSQNTPEEIIYECIGEIEEMISDDLISEIMSQTPEFFEHLVVDLLKTMYGGEFEINSEVTGQSGDGGIDGIVKQDRLGFDNIYIQAKKWNNTVSRPSIQEFSGALDSTHSDKGVFITTSYFSKQAIDYVKNINKKIVLIDGKELVKLMIEYGVGVEVKRTLVIKKIDRDYFHPEGRCFFIKIQALYFDSGFCLRYHSESTLPNISLFNVSRTKLIFKKKLTPLQSPSQTPESNQTPPTPTP